MINTFKLIKHRYLTPQRVLYWHGEKLMGIKGKMRLSLLKNYLFLSKVLDKLRIFPPNSLASTSQIVNSLNRILTMLII